MMNKKNSSLIVSIKYLLAAPLACILLLGNAAQASSSLKDVIVDEGASIYDASVDHSLSKQDGKKAIAPTPPPLSSRKNEKRQKNNSFPKIGDKTGDVYVVVDEMPGFPGGEAAMMAYIKQNLKYPKEAQDAGTQGRVTVRFIVRKTGEISDVTMVRGVNSLLDDEALRVVKAMPNWTPGKMKGEAVDVYYTLPIVYKLTKGGTVSKK